MTIEIGDQSGQNYFFPSHITPTNKEGWTTTKLRWTSGFRQTIICGILGVVDDSAAFQCISEPVSETRTRLLLMSSNTEDLTLTRSEHQACSHHGATPAFSWATQFPFVIGIGVAVSIALVRWSLFAWRPHPDKSTTGHGTLPTLGMEATRCDAPSVSHLEKQRQYDR